MPRSVYASLLIATSIFLAGCVATVESEEEAVSSAEAVSALGPQPEGPRTKYPILLAHGFMSSATGGGHFNPQIVAKLKEDHGKHRVFLGDVPPFAPVKDRAEYLKANVDDVLAKTGAKKVNIIAHSMGGLDARYLIHHYGYGDRIASLTTVATPHRGSRGADVALGLVGGVPEEALDAFAKLIGKTYSDVADDVDVKAALYDLTEKHAPTFNANNPNDPDVYYQSWAGVSSVLPDPFISHTCVPNPLDVETCHTDSGAKLMWHPPRADCMHAILVPAAVFVADGVHPNDGAVRVSSAKWGNFRGCYPADHADEIGEFSDTPFNEHTGWNYVRFYRNIAFGLAKKGF